MKDNLGPNLEHVDAKVEEAKRLTYQAVKSVHDEDLRKMKESFGLVIEEGTLCSSVDPHYLFSMLASHILVTINSKERNKWMAKVLEMDKFYQSEIATLKSEFSRSVLMLKGWHTITL